MYLTLMTSLFIGANLDFFILLIPLIKRHGFRDAVIGYIFGVASMYLISAMIGQMFQAIFPSWVIGILGLVPVCFGIKGGEEENRDKHLNLSILTVAFLYLTSCSADNVALYVPVLSTLTIHQSIFYGFYFILLALMTGILAYYTSNIKIVKWAFDKYGDPITRFIYILIGLLIIVESGLLEKVFNFL